MKMILKRLYNSMKILYSIPYIVLIEGNDLLKGTIYTLYILLLIIYLLSTNRQNALYIVVNRFYNLYTTLYIVLF